MSDFSFEKGSYIRANIRRRRRKSPILILIILILILLTVVSFFLYPKIKNKIHLFKHKEQIQTAIDLSDKNTSNEISDENKSGKKAEAPEMQKENLIKKASFTASMYDYDKAVSMLSQSEFVNDEDIVKMISDFENTKQTMVKKNIYEIPHVFFHILIYDTDKAFDNDSRSAGYNEVMTTIDEFKAILEELYKRNYVLVGLHDISYMSTDENGNEYMKEGDIMLPENKKPLVMSQDDVNYYEYMVGDGFASRLIVKDGRVLTQMDMEDGATKEGSFDLIPILDDFINEHPDFSYKGSKAIIALTGYNGVFGYRTDSSYNDKNADIEADKNTVREIADCLRNTGYELASHSWGHRHLGKIEYSHFVQDTDKWEENVESLIGDTDILVFPFGTDVGDWHEYSSNNERYNYLKSKGFRYFCNVDSSVPSWVQLGSDYLRQGRRNLDGYRMWRDINEPDNKKLSDLFDAQTIFDKRRPTPVGLIRS